MNIKQAIRVCKDKGWYVNITKYVLQNEGMDDQIFFDTDKELIEYADEIDKNKATKR